MLVTYLFIALGTIAVVAGLFAVLTLLDKKGGDRRTVGLLKMMAHFKASTIVDSMQRRIR